jgi:hypothetical protein
MRLMICEKCDMASPGHFVALGNDLKSQRRPATDDAGGLTEADPVVAVCANMKILVVDDDREPPDC